MTTERSRGHAPATLRNREPILAILKRGLSDSGLLLEIASGTGEHASFMAPLLGAGWRWQPSDANAESLADIDSHAAEAASGRIFPAVLLDVTAEHWPVTEADAILCCNMIHIAPFEAAEGLFAGTARTLEPGAPLILYGPFRRNGEHTAPSNAAFDASLKARDARWGVRCLDTEIMPLAEANGFALEEIVEMPANNLTVVFRRT
jgi:SAM-dependent methyltransferase